MKIYRLFFSFLFTATFLSHGQEYEKVVGVWNALFLNNKLGEQFHITTELHHRTVNGFENLDQQIFRPSLNYKSPSGMQWTVGYSYLRNFTWGGEIKSEFFKEHNMWEQLQFSITGKKGGSFANQLRLEHRFIEQRDGSKPYSFSSRIRYRFTYAYPLLKGPWACRSLATSNKLGIFPPRAFRRVATLLIFTLRDVMIKFFVKISY